jgi:hypothetical protein
MGFRRGSRSSRGKKEQVEQPSVDQTGVDEVNRQFVDSRDQGKLQSVPTRAELYAAEVVATKNAREKEQEKLREMKEQKREALRRSRQAERREHANHKRQQSHSKKQPVKRLLDPRIAVSGQSFRIVGKNNAGETLYQPLGPVVEERRIMPKSKKERRLQTIDEMREQIYRDLELPSGAENVSVEFEEPQQ